MTWLERKIVLARRQNQVAAATATQSAACYNSLASFVMSSEVETSSTLMRRFAYLFERFPSFGQTFCYREVAELDRQGVAPPIFSIRQPKDEPPQDWDPQIVARVHYLPEEADLVPEIDRLLKRKKFGSQVVDAVAEWGRRTDFLRLYQAIYVGLRLQEAGIDHVHAHFAGMAARTAFWIGKFFGISFSFTGHANDIFAPRDFETGLDQLMESANAVVTVSDFGVRYLKERFPPAAEKIHRVYNGIDLAKFQRADFRGSKQLIIAIGRLIEKKGFADLVRACEVLRKRGHDVWCQIIGEGPLESVLRADIDNRGLHEHLLLSGPLPQTEIGTRLAGATMFALPCIAEETGAMDNLPTVIMEAMAAGLPVVSTNVGGIPEMVVCSETGLLVSPGDPAALAEAIEKFIVDPALARKFGQAGYERSQTLFSIEKNVRELVRIIQ
jgi:glycosyltransferase involved in cell wall biosynthesis